VIASLVDTHLGTILGTYLIVFGSFAVLAWRIVARGRRLARHVPVEDRPWT
jgi:hypothetical protein